MAATDHRSEGYPATPELDKQLEIVKSGRAATVQEFLDWLLEEHRHRGQRIVLATYPDRVEDGVYSEQPVEIMMDRQRLMAEHFGVDLDAVERERRAVLEWVRSQPERQR